MWPAVAALRLQPTRFSAEMVSDRLLVLHHPVMRCSFFFPKQAWQVLSFKEAAVWQDSYLQTPAMLYVMFWPGGPFCGLCFIPEAPLFIFQEMALHSGGGVWI